jgi:hypothetical protein
MATLKQLVQIQSAIDNRAIASDTMETLETTYRYSRSKGVNIKIGDMHIDHFLRSLNLEKFQKNVVDIQTAQIIERQKKTLIKIKRLINEK